MLVIHPKDPTTEVLGRLYQKSLPEVEEEAVPGEGGVTVMTQEASTTDIKRALHHLRKSERLMLLGHGSDNGLFSRPEAGTGEFDRIIVGHPHAFYLRGRTNTVAIWCNADQFARKEGLHGLFSGMIVSEMEEAVIYGIATSQEELDREIPLFVDRLSELINSETPLWEVAALMKSFNFSPTPLNEFNYSHLYYL